MNLRSRLFDRIRVKSALKEEPRADQTLCQHPGCNEAGPFRAPMGRLREGQYFCFCLDHVREYNASYNYFNGMSNEAMADYQREALVGHRPTWSMGVKRGGKKFREESDDPPRPGEGQEVSQAGTRRYSYETPRKPRYGLAALRALDQLGLDDTVDMVVIKARYKDLVKRLHPDANAGDRSNEDKLREIIRAYNYLRSVKEA
ncbi:J domain-containing protein [Methylocapsa sp. D3K7]|uniref:J domain-containing protein n=1 Tax=Methylocapsa sp. D3K7 TaxID=3041435 RepID=UPI00244EBE4E|nr:J domain-containing protein [Methylocapsa sp. D3K7]WGJ14667.1 J domain-containing protein [Methylocapsa sp. D3K7]